MKTALFILSLFLITVLSPIQVDHSKSEFVIEGTSTIHDWESVVEEYTVRGEISESLIKGLHVSVKAESIKSGRGIMDDKTYDALKTEQFPTIDFRAAQLEIHQGRIAGKGKLTIAGVTKEVPFSASTMMKGGVGHVVKGRVPLKMTDFNIEPPTAMFGSLETGDEVVIRFEMILK